MTSQRKNILFIKWLKSSSNPTKNIHKIYDDVKTMKIERHFKKIIHQLKSDSYVSLKRLKPKEISLMSCSSTIMNDTTINSKNEEIKKDNSQLNQPHKDDIITLSITSEDSTPSIEFESKRESLNKNTNKLKRNSISDNYSFKSKKLKQHLDRPKNNLIKKPVSIKLKNRLKELFGSDLSDLMKDKDLETMVLKKSNDTKFSLQSQSSKYNTLVNKSQSENKDLKKDANIDNIPTEIAIQDKINKGHEKNIIPDISNDINDTSDTSLGVDSIKKPISEESVSSSSLELIIKQERICDSPEIVEMMFNEKQEKIENEFSKISVKNLNEDQNDISSSGKTIIPVRQENCLIRVKKHSSITAPSNAVLELNEEYDEDLDDLTQALITIINDLVRFRERYNDMKINLINKSFYQTEIHLATNDLMNCLHYKILFVKKFMEDRKIEDLRRYATSIVEKFNEKLNFSFNSNFINILHDMYIDISYLITNFNVIYNVEDFSSRIITLIDSLPEHLFNINKEQYHVKKENDPNEIILNQNCTQLTSDYNTLQIQNNQIQENSNHSQENPLIDFTQLESSESVINSNINNINMLKISKLYQYYNYCLTKKIFIDDEKIITLNGIASKLKLGINFSIFRSQYSNNTTQTNLNQNHFNMNNASSNMNTTNINRDLQDNFVVSKSSHQFNDQNVPNNSLSFNTIPHLSHNSVPQTTANQTHSNLSHNNVQQNTPNVTTYSNLIHTTIEQSLQNRIPSDFYIQNPTISKNIPIYQNPNVNSQSNLQQLHSYNTQNTDQVNHINQTSTNLAIYNPLITQHLQNLVQQKNQSNNSNMLPQNRNTSKNVSQPYSQHASSVSPTIPQSLNSVTPSTNSGQYTLQSNLQTIQSKNTKETNSTLIFGLLNSNSNVIHHQKSNNRINNLSSSFQQSPLSQSIPTSNSLYHCPIYSQSNILLNRTNAPLSNPNHSQNQPSPNQTNLQHPLCQNQASSNRQNIPQIPNNFPNLNHPQNQPSPNQTDLQHISHKVPNPTHHQNQPSPNRTNLQRPNLCQNQASSNRQNIPQIPNNFPNLNHPQNQPSPNQTDLQHISHKVPNPTHPQNQPSPNRTNLQRPNLCQNQASSNRQNIPQIPNNFPNLNHPQNQPSPNQTDLQHISHKVPNPTHPQNQPSPNRTNLQRPNLCQNQASSNRQNIPQIPNNFPNLNHPQNQPSPNQTDLQHTSHKVPNPTHPQNQPSPNRTNLQHPNLCQNQASSNRQYIPQAPNNFSNPNHPQNQPSPNRTNLQHPNLCQNQASSNRQNIPQVPNNFPNRNLPQSNIYWPVNTHSSLIPPISNPSLNKGNYFLYHNHQNYSALNQTQNTSISLFKNLVNSNQTTQLQSQINSSNEIFSKINMNSKKALPKPLVLNQHPSLNNHPKEQQNSPNLSTDNLKKINKFVLIRVAKDDKLTSTISQTQNIPNETNETNKNISTIPVSHSQESNKIIKEKNSHANDISLLKVTGDPLICTRCEKLAEITCRNCSYILFCGSTCENLHWESGHKLECL